VAWGGELAPAPLANLLPVLYLLAIVVDGAVRAVPALRVRAAHRSSAGAWARTSSLRCSSYSILGIAAVQAVALALLIHRLKHRRLHGLVAVMPPLQTMEDLLFRLIWTGELLLTLSIVTGALFLEDIFAQHLAHKTVLSIVAWLLFAVLLLGRSRLGWRGITAVKWTVAGFALLILAYFGSKLVLELVLHRPAW
jgi:ABC-type uncharacterized transport system permease subunit